MREEGEVNVKGNINLERSFRGEKLIKDEFFREINFPYIWVYVHTFCICISATLKV